MVLDGATNGLTFFAYVEQALVPTVATGEIVVMANLPEHKDKCIRRSIAAVGR